MVADDRQQIIKEIAQTALDRMRKEHLDGVMKEHSRQELIDKKMQEISERMNKLDARMQTLSHVFINGANSVDLSDLVEFGKPFESDSLKIYVDTKDNKMYYVANDTKKHTEYTELSEDIYEMKYVIGGNTDDNVRPTIKFEIERADKMMPLPVYIIMRDLSGNNPRYCFGVRYEKSSYPCTMVYRINGKEYNVESWVDIYYKAFNQDGSLSEVEQHINYCSLDIRPCSKDEVVRYYKNYLKDLVNEAKEQLKMSRQVLSRYKKYQLRLNKTFKENDKLMDTEKKTR